MAQHTVPASDPRSRQKRVGDALRTETRSSLLDAAAREFAERGYAGSTVSRIAATAGVSVQTLYLCWGSKRALLRGYLEHALAGDRGSPEDAAGLFAGIDPEQLPARLAELVADVAQRAALGWHLYRDAAAVDPAIAADWNELQLLRHRLLSRVFSSVVAGAGQPELVRAEAVDTAWVITSPESYDLLVRRLGYDLDRYRTWMRDAITAAMFAH